MNITKQQIKDFHKLSYRRGLDGHTTGKALRVLCDVGVGDMGTMMEATDEYAAEVAGSSRCLQPAKNEELEAQCDSNEELASCIRNYDDKPIFMVGERVYYEGDSEDTGTVKAIISPKRLYAVEWDSPSELDAYEGGQLTLIEDKMFNENDCTCPVESCDIDTTGDCAKEDHGVDTDECAVDLKNVWQDTNFDEDSKYIITRKLLNATSNGSYTASEVDILAAALQDADLMSASAFVDSVTDTHGKDQAKGS